MDGLEILIAVNTLWLAGLSILVLYIVSMLNKTIIKGLTLQKQFNELVMALRT